MVKISDILRRGHDEEEPPKKKPEQPQEVAPEQPSPLAPIEQGEKKALPEEVQKEAVPVKKEEPPNYPLKIAAVMRDKTKATRPEADQFYHELLALSQNILSSAAQDLPLASEELLREINRAIDQMALAPEELTELTNNASPENYLFAHLVNVALLAIKVGLGLGYNKSRLTELGLAAFLHDVGMVKVMDVVQRPKRLSKEEYAQVKQHPQLGGEILKKIEALPEAVISACYQHHERVNRSGYPQGLKNAEIGEDARIIGLVDVYEALTHPRVYRPKFLAYEAIKEMLKYKEQFDAPYLKVLIEEMGIYPIGSWVQLNSDEIGKVVKVERNFPLQPTINVIFSPDGHRLEETKSIDLTKHPTIYIRKPLDDKELAVKFTAGEAQAEK